ncbi:MAG: MAPEG family protein [Hyphomicrobiales bacterium]
MAGELVWLALACGLILVLWIPYILSAIVNFGLFNAMKMTNDQAGLPDWAQRCHRAHMNMVENLAPFAALVLILNVSGKADEATVLTCAVFVLARLVHAFVYIAGIPYVRTLTFAIGWLACLVLFFQALS